MEPIQVEYASAEEIPEKYRDLYAEKDGKHILSGVAGIIPAPAYEAAEKALKSSRRAETEMKTEVERWREFAEGTSVEEFAERFTGMREQIEALEGEDLDAKIAAAKGSLERQLKAERTRRERAEAKLADTSKAQVRETIKSSVLAAATGAGILPTAIDDALARVSAFEQFEDGTIATAPNNGFEPGLSPTEWIEASKTTHPHWWGASKGAGASGNGGEGARQSGEPKHRQDFKDSAAKAAWIAAHRAEGRDGAAELLKLPPPPSRA